MFFLLMILETDVMVERLVTQVAGVGFNPSMDTGVLKHVVPLGEPTTANIALKRFLWEMNLLVNDEFVFIEERFVADVALFIPDAKVSRDVPQQCNPIGVKLTAMLAK